MKRLKLKYLFFTACVFIILKVFGVFTHLFERDFYNDFHYPYDGDVHESVEQLRHNQKPDIAPINFYNFNYIINSEHKCKSSDGNILPLRLVYIIKSAVSHFSRRIAIRNSWGYEHRFSDVDIRTVFVLGTDENYTLMEKVNMESKQFKDIVQANFIDSYYNNTIKTMMGFRWAVSYCPTAKFYMFVDDDMYVSTKNVLKFVRNPTNYPAYLTEPIVSLKLNSNNVQHLNEHKINKRSDQSILYQNKEQSTINSKKYINATFQKNNPQSIEVLNISDSNVNRQGINNLGRTLISKNIAELEKKRSIAKRQIMDFELPNDVILYTGYVFISSPHRHISSKWHVPLDEYPYHMWPPYVTAGSYIVSNEALHDLYYTSFYTKHFRFDDIYLGLVALKANIEPYHCIEFHFYKKPYNIEGYKFIISSHGYEDPEELLRVWNEQRSAGYA